MPLSMSSQDEIQALIDNSSKDEIEELVRNAENTLQEVNILSGQKFLSGDEKKSAEIAVETLVRVESTEKNKGWWFRTKRRLQIMQMYMGA